MVAIRKPIGANPLRGLVLAGSFGALLIGVMPVVAAPAKITQGLVIEGVTMVDYP